MPRFYFQDGTSRNVSQVDFERLQDEADAAWMEAFCLAKWFAWIDWTSEFGENNPNFPFNTNGMEIYKEAERLQGN